MVGNSPLVERTPEQRARDAGLAWLIVGVSGVVTLALVALLAIWGAGQLSRSIAAQQQTAAAARRDAQEEMRRIAEAAPVSDASDEPLPVAAGPPPPTDARPLGSPATWIGADDYPPSAQRNGWEGRVKVTVAVDRAGSPTGCAVRQSSGHWSLDNATCAAMLNHGRFDIAAQGPRVRHWTSPVIRWTLPEENDVPFDKADATVAKGDAED